jgi:hypothetical protein
MILIWWAERLFPRQCPIEVLTAPQSEAQHRETARKTETVHCKMLFFAARPVRRHQNKSAKESLLVKLGEMLKRIVAPAP